MEKTEITEKELPACMPECAAHIHLVDTDVYIEKDNLGHSNSCSFHVFLFAFIFLYLRYASMKGLSTSQTRREFPSYLNAFPECVKSYPII